MLQVSGNALQQGEKVKYIGVVFTSDSRWIEEIDARIGHTKAVLRELCCSVVTKRELSNTAKLSVIESFFVPILTYGHESWILEEYYLRCFTADESRWTQCPSSAYPSTRNSV